MDDFPKLVNNQAENSSREGMRVFPTFQLLAEFRQVSPHAGAARSGGKKDRLHRCESMQIRRSTLDFYLVERTEDERQSPRYLYLGGIDDGVEKKNC